MSFLQHICSFAIINVDISYVVLMLYMLYILHICRYKISQYFSGHICSFIYVGFKNIYARKSNIYVI